VDNEYDTETADSFYISHEQTAFHTKNRHIDDEGLELEAPKAQKRRQAIMRLVSSQIKEDQVFGLLSNIASTEASNIKQAVTRMLKQLRHSPLPPLEILQNLADADPEPSMRELAIIILGCLGNMQSPLSEILHDLMWCDPDPYVRETATIILGQSGNMQPQVIASLQKLARDDCDPHVREAAITALNQSDNMQQDNLGSLLPILADLETNPDTKTTMSAIEQLGRHHPKIVQQLVEIVSDGRRIKDLVHDPTEVYRRQLYIETLIRNLQILKYLGSDQQEVIDTLFANLTSQNEDIRRTAIAALSKQGATNPQVVLVLIDMLSDRAETVRNEAVNVLGELGKLYRHVLEAMVNALEKNTLVDKRAIAEALRKSGCTKPFVIDALLSLLARSTSSEDLLETMLMSHPSDRQAVVETLAHLGANNNRVLQALLHTLEDPDLIVRAAAVSALAHLGQDDVTVCQAVLHALYDKSPSVRQAAASALGKIGWKSSDIIDALLKARQDPDLHVRKSAIPALIQLGSDQRNVQEALQKDLTHTWTKVRREVALAFTQQQQVDPVFIPMLLNALHDEHPSVQGNIALALGKIGGNSSEKLHVCYALIEAFHAASSSTLRSDILLALGKISDKKAFTRGLTNPVLIEALGDADSSVRYSAALSLARQEHDEPEIVSVLLASLLDTEAPYRQEIITILNHATHNRPAIKDALLRSLADADQAVREAAANALAVIGENEDRSDTGERLEQRLEGYKKIAERQLTADPTIEAALCALQYVMGDI
jgi:HEAT repeat protein